MLQDVIILSIGAGLFHLRVTSVAVTQRGLVVFSRRLFGNFYLDK